MSVSNRLRKLQHMTGGEILWRIREKLMIYRERLVFRSPRTGNSLSQGLDPLAKSLLPRARELVPGTRRTEWSQLAIEAPHLHRQISNEAAARQDRLLTGAWNCLGHPLDLRSLPDWSRDPVTGHHWPSQFFADVPVYDLPGEIDVKRVWELGRHQFLFTLGAGWLTSGDDASPKLARALLLDWIHQNPLYAGVHWTSALEPAMRVISWLWSLAALADWTGWSDADLWQISRSLEAHGQYIIDHVSLYSSPYNHLIGEAAALFLLGCWLESPRAAGWRKTGARLLTEHAPRQFHSDGVCVEQAMGYQFYTLMFLTLAWCAAGTAGGELAPLTATLRRAWNAAAVFQQPDGLWPAMGDVDSARTVPVLPECLWDFRGLCGIGAVLFDDPDARGAAGQPGEELYWLLGARGVAEFQRQSSTSQVGCRQLPASGYVICRSQQTAGDWLFVDAGPVSDGLHADATPSTAHGHADLLQVLVHLEGKPFLIDSGMSNYAGPREWVDWFRDARAHNTLEVAGAPVARHAGRLGWSHVCQTYSLESACDGNLWMVHAACQPVAGVAVNRYVLMLPGKGLWIVDQIRTPEPHQVDWSFNLADHAAQRLVDWNEQTVPIPLIPWELRAVSNAGVPRVQLVRAAAGQPIAWRGTDYGVRVPGLQLRFQQECQEELVVMFSFLPPGGGIEATLELAGSKVGLSSNSPARERQTPALPPPAGRWSIRGPGNDFDIAWGFAAPPDDALLSRLGSGGWPCWKQRLDSRDECGSSAAAGDPHGSA